MPVVNNNNIISTASNVSSVGHHDQHVSTNPHFLPSSFNADYDARRPWNVSLSLPTDTHASPTMVTPACKVTSGSPILPGNYASATNNNVSSYDVENVQQRWRSALSSYRFLTSGATSPEDGKISTMPETDMRSKARGEASKDDGTSLSMTSDDGHTHHKKNNKYKLKYQDRMSANVKYKCGTCDYCTNRSDHYKRHLLTHSEVKPFKCCKCGYGTGRSDHFRRHLTRHGLSSEEVTRQYQINGIKTPNCSDPSQRGKQRQTAQKQQPNQQVQQQAQQENEQSPHQQLPHQLMQYQRRFSNSGAIKYDVSPHTSIFPSRHLIHHHSPLAPSHTVPPIRIRKHPDGDVSETAVASAQQPKRYTCKQCGYATDRHSHYARHVRTHSSERPFACDACGKRFKLDDYRKKHRCMKATPDEAGFDVQTPSSQGFGGVDGGVVPPMCARCGVWFQHGGEFAAHSCLQINGL